MAHADAETDSDADVWIPEAVPSPFRRGVAFVVEWIPLLVVVALWEVVSGRVVATAILPSPVTVADTTWQMIVTGEILPHLAVSLWRVALGLGLSIAVGVLLGVGMAWVESVENFFDVFLSMIYPIPKTALVPLSILWLGSGTQTAVLIVFLACLLPIVLNTYNAASDVDQHLVWAARMMGTDDRQILRKVAVPATVPEILTGIRQAIPIAFIALVSAELIASDMGVGYLILISGQIGNYPTMFATIVVISAVAYAAVRGYEVVRERVLVWN